MAPRLRRMHTYRPRPRKEKAFSSKHALLEIERKISGELGALILALEQQELPKVTSLQLQLRTDFHKHKEDMLKAAETLGSIAIKTVRQFLDSVDKLIHTTPEFIDPATIHTCYTTRRELEKLFEAA